MSHEQDLKKLIDRLRTSDTRIKRRNARRAMFKLLARIKTELSEEFPVIDKRGESHVRRPSTTSAAARCAASPCGTTWRWEHTSPFTTSGHSRPSGRLLGKRSSVGVASFSLKNRAGGAQCTNTWLRETSCSGAIRAATTCWPSGATSPGSRIPGPTWPSTC